ncbi:ankyrin repeat domain-containing protein SOWAHA-like isoform X2 [Anabas testudineus]|uniref:ankyrin repeat domain-containing protein SOWAHA-like isoform X2 n=1 Tax=Anabas testudineus TaxID=64144 RepID=UPI000E45CD49|nr:ankyrin repeat domain-containing protein SOWAHA-like isoform X2 [Anabas testudineus]
MSSSRKNTPPGGVEEGSERQGEGDCAAARTELNQETSFHLIQGSGLTMVLTQESIVSLLIAEGGKVKKSDLVEKFKGLIDCVDPAEKARNRELFRTLVNNVACVKEIDGVRYVVIKKVYEHLLENGPTAESPVEKSGNQEVPRTGEQQRPPVRSEQTVMSQGAGGERSAELDQELASESMENPSELLSPIELALQRARYADVKVKRKMSFEIFKSDADGGNCTRKAVNAPTTLQSKPYALPLRMPPSTTRIEVRKLKQDPHDPPETQKLDPCKSKRKPTIVETMTPLEISEHEWLVKCASGHWSQVYGLLLRDHQLAEKRDFISGFTALHWVAKCGNSEMLVKIIDISKQGGTDVDINARTHGGYTPLHIAALHNQEYVMAMLVGEYGANVSIRDNCGKKAYHYLSNSTSGTLREMLGGPKSQQAEDKALHEKEELDLIRDLSKGRHSISRIFQPHVTGHKKRDKQRPGLYSLSNEPGEEREDKSGGFRHRIMSDSFM